MQVATRAIAGVGRYNPFDVSPDPTNFPTGAQVVSGVEEARRAVREQIGHGADLIKVYADWDNPTLTVEEMRVIVEEAHKQKRKVAAHTTTREGIKNALTAGVDSIEHGYATDREGLEMMKAKGTFLVPTIGAIDLQIEKYRNDPVTPERRQRREVFLHGIQQSVQTAKSLGRDDGGRFRCGERGRSGHECNRTGRNGAAGPDARGGHSGGDHQCR